MRLSSKQTFSIQSLFREHFLSHDQLWLFGSRVDDTQKGGDIDLYIETQHSDLEIIAVKKIQFLVALKKEMGDQKIDVIINPILLNRTQRIYQEARKNGVLLV